MKAPIGSEEWWKRVQVQAADPRPCEHTDVQYFADEKGAVACMDCGRLFGHLEGETFVAFNPGPSHIVTGYVRAHENGGHAKYGAIAGCPLCEVS